MHNPNVAKLIRPYITTYYRDEKDRIERLILVIRKEAEQCSSKDPTNNGQGVEDDMPDSLTLSEMAQLAWCWICTDDRYSGVVSDIVLSLPPKSVRALALTKNPKSEPVPEAPIKDCSAPRCALVLESRLSFLGRYALDRVGTILHRSETNMVLRAEDIGAQESYLAIRSFLDTAEPDIDDYSHTCGSVHAIAGGTVTLDRFTRFVRRVGLCQQDALAEVEGLPPPKALAGPDTDLPLRERRVEKWAFDLFCRRHAIDCDGRQTVAIKFMASRQGFDLERQCRDILRERYGSYRVVPVLKHFSIKKGNDITIEMFKDGPKLVNLSRFRYGIVMPCADSNLRDIVYKEGISCLQQTVSQVGDTLLALHEQGVYCTIMPGILSKDASICFIYFLLCGSFYCPSLLHRHLVYEFAAQKCITVWRWSKHGSL